MVTFNKTNKFYSRTSAGAYLLDLEEIRNLFNLSGSRSERPRTFRIERLTKITSGETPISLESIPKIVLHLIPLNPVQSDLTQFSLNPGFIGNRFNDLGPSLGIGKSNFDGYVEYSYNPLTEPAYLQVFRNGSIEYVWTHPLWQKENKKIPDVAFERQFIRAVKHLLGIQEDHMEIKPPIFVVLTLMNVRGYAFMQSGSHTIDRDSLLIPEIMIETFPHNKYDIEKELKKILDIFWNAVGFPYSPNFDSTGKWTGDTV